MASTNVIPGKFGTQPQTTINRRIAIAALPLALGGIHTVVKGFHDFTPTSAPGILDERALNYSLELITDASTSGIASSFLAFAQHVSNLASAGDCETIGAVAERFTDRLYQEHNCYHEPRETWVAEELEYFTTEVVDMDDPALTTAQREAASDRADARHERRVRGSAA